MFYSFVIHCHIEWIHEVNLYRDVVLDTIFLILFRKITRTDINLYIDYNNNLQRRDLPTHGQPI